MKKIIILSVLFLNFSFSFGQLLDCPDHPNPNAPQPPNNIYSRSVLAPPPTSNKYVFNVKFHIVKNTNGTGPTANYGENEVMNAIMILNTNYNQFNIFFKYVGFDVLKNTLYTKLRSGTVTANQNTAHPFFQDLILFSKSGLAPIFTINALNLFIVEGIDYDTLSGLPVTAGVANRPGIESVFAYNTLLTSTLPHEIGHNFNLLHTQQGSGAPGCELVNGSNSATAGDLVTDTPASHVLNNSYLNSASCGYFNYNNRTDCSGTTYVNVPVRNFMSSNNNCRIIAANYLPGNANFTQGQGNRMREQIDTYYNSTAYGYLNAKNDIESLYEPFQIVANVVTSGTTSRTYTPNSTNTGANVWNCPTYTLRFQKGFNWIFSNSTIGTVTKSVTDQYNYSINNNLLNVQIPYLGPDILSCGNISCFSTFEPFIDGSVKSLSNLGSQTIEIKDLNPIEASSPNLIDTLESGKYHIITKETESGFTDEKIIFKN